MTITIGPHLDYDELFDTTITPTIAIATLSLRLDFGGGLG